METIINVAITAISAVIHTITTFVLKNALKLFSKQTEDNINLKIKETEDKKIEQENKRKKEITEFKKIFSKSLIDEKDKKALNKIYSTLSEKEIEEIVQILLDSFSSFNGIRDVDLSTKLTEMNNNTGINYEISNKNARSFFNESLEFKLTIFIKIFEKIKEEEIKYKTNMQYGGSITWLAHDDCYKYHNTIVKCLRDTFDLRKDKNYKDNDLKFYTKKARNNRLTEKEEECDFLWD